MYFIFESITKLEDSLVIFDLSTHHEEGGKSVRHGFQPSHEDNFNCKDRRRARDSFLNLYFCPRLNNGDRGEKLKVNGKTFTEETLPYIET